MRLLGLTAFGVTEVTRHVHGADLLAEREFAAETHQRVFVTGGDFAVLIMTPCLTGSIGDLRHFCRGADAELQGKTLSGEGYI